MDHYAQAPIAQAALPILAAEYMKFARALVGKSRKCVVVDLDNTLFDASRRVFPFLHDSMNAYIRAHLDKRIDHLVIGIREFASHRGAGAGGSGHLQ